MRALAGVAAIDTPYPSLTRNTAPSDCCTRPSGKVIAPAVTPYAKRPSGSDSSSLALSAAAADDFDAGDWAKRAPLAIPITGRKRMIRTHLHLMRALIGAVMVVTPDRREVMT
jgi:hypothetical protein